MSKSIGGVLVHYPHQENVGNVNNYLTSPNLPSLDDNQALSINNINPNPMTLAQGLRNANQTEFIDYDLDMQIKNLQTLMPNNPALQQQYSAALTKALASQINNAQADITNPLHQQMQQNNPFDILNIKNNLFALSNLSQAYNQLSPLKINDKYKHSVISCIGAQGGLPSTIATVGLGVAKELYDIVRKSFNPQKYGGYNTIIKDSWQDLQADINGIIQGYNNPVANCNNIMKNFYSPDIK